jgi:hypothetical protein
VRCLCYPHLKKLSAFRFWLAALSSSHDPAAASLRLHRTVPAVEGDGVPRRVRAADREGAQAAGCNEGLIDGWDIGGARMWRMSNAQAVIFVALVVIAVALMLLARSLNPPAAHASAKITERFALAFLEASPRPQG